MIRKIGMKVLVRHVAINDAALREAVTRVRQEKEYVVFEKDGVPVAAMMDVDEFEDYLELHDPEVEEHIRASNQEFRAGNNRAAADLSHELHELTRAQEKRGAG